MGGPGPWAAQCCVVVLAMSLAAQTSPDSSKEITGATLASSGHLPYTPGRPCAFPPPGPPPVSRGHAPTARNLEQKAPFIQSHGPECPPWTGSSQVVTSSTDLCPELANVAPWASGRHGRRHTASPESGPLLRAAPPCSLATAHRTPRTVAIQAESPGGVPRPLSSPHPLGTSEHLSRATAISLDDTGAA